MIDVSDDFIQAINADSRNVKSYIEIYFDGDDEEPDVFDDDDIFEIEIIEEMKADEVWNPLGMISSNELVLKLHNEDGQFTSTNEDSPYYEDLQSNVLIKPYIGVVTQEEDGEQEEEIEYVSMGEYRTSEWAVMSTDIIAEIVCYDRLYFIRTDRVDSFRTQFNTDMQALFEMTFESIGLESDEYNIDEELDDISIKIGWIPEEPVIDVLHLLAEASRCYVFVDRDGKFRVRKMGVEGDPVETIGQDNQIIQARVPVQYLDRASKVVTRWNIPRLASPEIVVEDDSIEVPESDSVTVTRKTDEGPVGLFTKIQVSGSEDIEVTVEEITAWEITVEITNNNSESEVVELFAEGRLVKSSAEEVETSDEDLIDRIGLKRLETENKLLQDREFVETYNSDLFNQVSDLQPNVVVDYRGNPAFELGDIITIDDPIEDIEEDMAVYRHILTYDGVLRGEMEGFRVIDEGE